MNKRFWMVLVEGSGETNFKHDTLELAENEARRLARLTGKRVHILESIKCLQLNDVEQVLYDYESDHPIEPPF